MGGTIWLDSIAWVLCAGRRGIYALDGAICDGVPPFVPARQAVIAGEMVSVPGILEAGTGGALSMFWLILPDVADVDETPTFAPAWLPGPTVSRTAMAAAGPRLPFLAARGLRELNPESPEERALSAALGRRTAVLPIHPFRIFSVGVSAANRMLEPSLNDLLADVGRLAGTYDPSVWGEEEPDQPVSPDAIVLGGVVVFSEMVVLVSLVWGMSDWSTRASKAVGLAVGAGAVGLATPIFQFFVERGRDSWRVSAVRDSLMVQLTGGADRAAPLTDLRGTVVVRTETLLLGARNGYNPTLLLAVMVGTCALYALFALAILLCTARQWWKQTQAGGGP